MKLPVVQALLAPSKSIRNISTNLFCNLIESGEQSGALETMLDRVAIYKEKTEALKSKIKSAIKYPIAVVSIALVVTALLLI